MSISESCTYLHWVGPSGILVVFFFFNILNALIAHLWKCGSRLFTGSLYHFLSIFS
ncbi:hypothetical protein NITLEN_10970 [Nitrospira lenta]|uniref:Uncharacterized protein n=1 Tax=Nitrospira lenta TaxID=1436998 RepID=A0A330L2L3_9BACT|nr:hypothetical protein NITLEN_10970 [Nitrospira lenta]